MTSEPPKGLDRGHSFTKRVSDNDTPKSLIVSQDSVPKTSASEEFRREREELEEDVYDDAEEN